MSEFYFQKATMAAKCHARSSRERIAKDLRRDETRRSCRDEWEHVSRGCFCTAEVLTQLYKRLLAPLFRASVLLLPLVAPSTLSPSPSFPQLPPLALSLSLILRRRCRRHPPLPRPRTYFSSYFIFICFSPPRPPALVPSPPPPPLSTALRCTPPPAPRTSFRIIFILSSAILVNAIPPVVREPFFLFCV